MPYPKGIQTRFPRPTSGDAFEGGAHPREQNWLRHGRTWTGSAVRYVASAIVLCTILLASLGNPGPAQAAMDGIAFGPFGAGQDPTRGSVVSPEQIRLRLQTVAPYTDWVRVYGTSGGLDAVPRIASDLRLRTAAGAWIGRDRIANEREIARLTAACRAGLVDLAIIGSEVLLRRDLPVDILVGYLDAFRRANPGVKVGYADVHEQILAHPQLALASDVVLAHIYPYWHGIPVEHAVPWLAARFDRVRAAFPRKLIVIAETGWPDGGNAVGGAVPSPQNQERYLREFLGWASKSGVRYFVFSAFDESWKAAHEGPQGAHWGLWDESVRPKAHLHGLLEAQRKNTPILPR